jgi:lysophospholipase L1-like esterase
MTAVDTDTAEIPAPPRGRERSARDAVICVAVCALLLLAFEGSSIRRAGRDLDHGWQRTLVLAVGEPAGWLSDASGLGAVKDRALAWERRDRGAGGGAGFDDRVAGGGVAPVTPEAIDPRAVGARPATPPPLRTVLVTGDSMSQPLDATLARAFARAGDAKVVHDAHLGTGISQPDILDWGAEAGEQVRDHHPQAVVVFLGANEGFPLRAGRRDVDCCGVAWTTAYASRVRQMMSTYRQRGAARVYWLELPGPRDAARQRISRAVNAAIVVAAEAYRAQVRVIDLGALFTPGGSYREAMAVDGREQIVREHDGVHLNGIGARVALAPVLAALHADFGAAVPR